MNGQGSGATALDPVEEAIFHAAGELSDPLVRAAFLDRVCGGDAGFRGRIETLLEAEVRAQRFLAGDPFELEPADEPLARPATTRPDEAPGTVIGRYRLLKPIGEGGMGVVYLAEQQEPVRRRVALKIIKLGMDTRQVIARFEAERQALALMDHPNIAKVLDGGVTGGEKSEARGSKFERSPNAEPPHPASGISAGRPYFVMELVEGAPITEFCERSGLSIEQHCHPAMTGRIRWIVLGIREIELSMGVSDLTILPCRKAPSLPDSRNACRKERLRSSHGLGSSRAISSLRCPLPR